MRVERVPCGCVCRNCPGPPQFPIGAVRQQMAGPSGSPPRCVEHERVASFDRMASMVSSFPGSLLDERAARRRCHAGSGWVA